MGKRNFYCPHCGQSLLMEQECESRIVLGIKTVGDKRGIALFNTELGKYDTNFDQDTATIIKGKDGFKVNFNCPMCLSPLLSRYEDFNKIKMIEPNGEEKCVLFSREHGIKLTVTISRKTGKIERFSNDEDDGYLKRYPENYFKKEKRKVLNH